MTAFEVARLIAEIVRAFGLAWDRVREVVLLGYPHMEPHIDAAIADMDRERERALARVEKGSDR